MKNIGIIGAAGLSGLELMHWLRKHPHITINVITSSKYEGQKLKKAFPKLTGLDLVFEAHNTSRIESCDLVFLAVPNQASLDMVPALIEKGIKVVDLSGVYRLQDIESFKRFYKLEHTSPELLKKAVFGLPEFFKDSIQSAQLIANPGCYPTGALLGLLPFGELLGDLASVPIIDAKSGVSGAGGRVESDEMSYVGVNENFKAYKVFAHQHQPEIQAYLEVLTPYDKRQLGEMIFTPHLLPLDRGILSTIYLNFNKPVSRAQVDQCFNRLAQNPFVEYLPKGQLPDLQMVQNTNFCRIGAESSESQKQWIIITAIDNLVKGASGQAIQNMNLMLGFDEDLALT
ncbi:N-acetyl-gamma-glutamyl-phosphate reductase [Deltaproteobacteria bacterium TL4]